MQANVEPGGVITLRMQSIKNGETFKGADKSFVYFLKFQI